MTKRDLVVRISEKTGLVQQQVFEIVQLTLDSIASEVAHGRTVELRNFGVFEVKIRKARIGRNPNQPKRDVPIPSRAVVKFKPGKEMREAVLKLTPLASLAAAAKAAPAKKVLPAPKDGSAPKSRPAEKKLPATAKPVPVKKAPATAKPAPMVNLPPPAAPSSATVPASAAAPPPTAHLAPEGTAPSAPASGT